MEFDIALVMKAQKAGCNTVSFGCNSASTSPLELQLHAGWVQAEDKFGYAGALCFNGHNFRWMNEAWQVTNPSHTTKTYAGDGSKIVIPALISSAPQFSRMFGTDTKFQQ